MKTTARPAGGLAVALLTIVVTDEILPQPRNGKQQKLEAPINIWLTLNPQTGRKVRLTQNYGASELTPEGDMQAVQIDPEIGFPSLRVAP